MLSWWSLIHNLEQLTYFSKGRSNTVLAVIADKFDWGLLRKSKFVFAWYRPFHSSVK